MVRVGVTGHIRLRPSSGPVIYRALLEVLRRFPDLHGVTCAAEGSDRLFARAVRECGGTYEVILPATDSGRVRSDGALRRVLAGASGVRTAGSGRVAEESYAAASREMLRDIDLLVAVWDGVPNGGPGGTADTVSRARADGTAVHVVWPKGARRAALP